MLLRFTILFAGASALWAAPVPPFTLKTVDRAPVNRAIARVSRPTEFWMGPISEAERAPKMLKPGVMRAGVHRVGGDEFLSRGQWSELPDGRAVFQAALRSPGATGLRLEFVNFADGAGRVWLYPGDETHPTRPIGPYEGGEDTWSGLVEGESVVLEFEAAAGAPRMLPFQLGRISHISANVGTSAAPRAAALSCNLDVTCYPEWADKAKGVARYLFETSGGGALCSGSLINTRNNSGIPYFLTADHCISNEAEARSVQAFWFYQSSVCNGAPRSLRDVPTTSGAAYMAGGSMEQGDFTLLRLTGTLPNGVTFAGWVPEELPIGANVTGIHHPTGDYKRVSFGNRRTPALVRGWPEPKFYTINWRQGVTEGGSSGSPLFNDDGLLVGTLTGGEKSPEGKDKCDVTPALSWYGRFSTAFPTLQGFLEERTLGPTPTPPPTGGGTTGTLLASSVAANFTVGPVAGASLLPGIYRVDVPQGATRLEIRLRTTTPNVDIDLFARAGSAPIITEGRVTSDFSAATDSGDETIVITPTSSPALRPGTYFIAMALFTTGVEARGTLTAIATGGGSTTPPPTTSTTVALTSGVARAITLEPTTVGTLLTGSNAYRIEVPQGATRLEIRLETETRNVDVDLFARFGQESVVADRAVLADHRSEGDAANEVITITPSSTPTLRAGTYFIHLGVFTANTRILTRLTATVTGGTAPPPASGATVLTSGTARAITLEPTTEGTLLGGGNAYRIDVPQGSTRLEIRLESQTSNVDVDLYARFNAESQVVNQAVVADHRSEGPGGNEVITITPTSSPALRSGTYFINLGIFTANTRISARLTATVTGGGTTPPTTPPPAGGNRTLVSGAPSTYSFEPVSSPQLFTSDSAYQISVPAGATRLEVRISTTTPGVDVDLYVRAGEVPRVSSGAVQADYSSEGDTGDETIVITPQSTPPLRAGTYFIALGVFTPNIRINGTVLATVTTAGSSNTVGQPLIAGLLQRFAIAPVSSAALVNDPSFRIDVPSGTGRVRVLLQTTTPNADVDLYARFAQAPAIAGGAVVADYKSEGSAGDESLDITPQSTPALRSGTLFISLGLFATGERVEGSVVVYIDTAATPPQNAVELTSGVPGRFTLPATASPALYSGTSGFRIQVPVGATSLTVRLNTTTPNADVDLYVRRGSDVDLGDGEILADFFAEGPTGNESLTITRTSSPPLEPGTYFIGLGNFARNTQVTGVVTATVERAPSAPAAGANQRLTFGQPSSWRFAAVTGPTLLSGESAFRLDVTNVSRMEIELKTDTPGADLDLYVRYGSPPVVQNGTVVADFSSTGLTGNEKITIFPGANSPLRSGTYYVAMAVFTPGVATSGTVLAKDLSGGSTEALKLSARRKFGEKATETELSKSTQPEDPMPADGRQPLKGKYGPIREQE